MQHVLRVPFVYDPDEVSNETGLYCADESKAVQSAKEECDINVIVRRFHVTGELPSNVKVPLEGEFQGVMTYKDAMNLIVEAERSFMEMPADVRERFNHDPGKFVAFASDEKNRDEARKLGLLVPAEEPREEVPLLVRMAPADPGAVARAAANPTAPAAPAVPV